MVACRRRCCRPAAAASQPATRAVARTHHCPLSHCSAGVGGAQALAHDQLVAGCHLVSSPIVAPERCRQRSAAQLRLPGTARHRCSCYTCRRATLREWSFPRAPQAAGDPVQRRDLGPSKGALLRGHHAQRLCGCAGRCAGCAGRCGQAAGCTGRGCCCSACPAHAHPPSRRCHPAQWSSTRPASRRCSARHARCTAAAPLLPAVLRGGLALQRAATANG